MYELNQLTDRTFYIESPAKIGLYKTGEDEVILIDTGNDISAAKKVKKILNSQGWKLKAIYNTHSNADHIGGNQDLQKQFGCPIYSPDIEACFSRHPQLEPSLLYGGFPFKELRHKFLMAKPSDVQDLKPENLPEGFEMIDLPGHFLQMAGFKTPDGVIFLADCLSSEATIDKYALSFIYDVKSYLQTLEVIKKLRADWFVPAHAEAAQDIQKLADLNIRTVHEIEDAILLFCKDPIGFEDLLAKVFEHYGLMMTYEQYVLIGSTLRSYLAYLKDEGRLNSFFENNRLYFQAV